MGTSMVRRAIAMSLVLLGLRRGAVFAVTGKGADLSSPSAPEATAGETAPGGLLRDPDALTGWIATHNQQVVAARARVRQAEEDVAQARLRPNPTVQASAGDYAAGRTNPPGLGYPDTAIYSTGLAELFEIGKRGPRIRSAELRLRSEEESYLDALTRVLSDGRAALARVVYLAAKRAVLEESLEASRQLLGLERSRLENGDISGSDYDRLAVDAALLESEVGRTRSESFEAEASCRAIFAAPCRADDIDLAQVSAVPDVPGAPDVEAALAERPDLRSIDLDAMAARQEQLLARRRRLPDPTVSLTYTHDNLVISGDQPKTFALGIGFALPVVDRGQHDSARAAARAAELEAGARDGRLHARSDIDALVERRTFLEKTLADLQAEALPKARSVLDATVSAVNQGGLSMTDLLLARRTHIDIMLRVMDLQFDAFNVRNDLRRALGLDARLARSSPGLLGAGSEGGPHDSRLD